MNLNGRIVGKLGGKILVALTVEEYLDALPDLTAMMPPAVVEGERRRPAALPAMRPVYMREDPPSDPVSGRVPGRATPAQQRFNGKGWKKKAAKGEVPGLAPRTCPYCSKSYQPVRRDQTFCLAPACKKLKDAAYREAHKKPRGKGKPAAAGPAAPESGPSASVGGRMTKEQRLAQIREVARRVNARHAGEGGTLRGTIPDTPPELAEAAAAARED